MARFSPRLGRSSQAGWRGSLCRTRPDSAVTSSHGALPGAADPRAASTARRADDLISAGVVGLIDAFSKFDHTKQVQFRANAQFRIRGAISGLAAHAGLESARAAAQGGARSRRGSAR